MPLNPKFKLRVRKRARRMTILQLLKSRMNQRLLHKRRKQSLSPNLLSHNQIPKYSLLLKSPRRRKIRRKRSRSRKSSPSLSNLLSPSSPSLLRKLKRPRVCSLHLKKKFLSLSHSLGRHWLKRHLSKLMHR